MVGLNNCICIPRLYDLLSDKLCIWILVLSHIHCQLVFLLDPEEGILVENGLLRHIRGRSHSVSLWGCVVGVCIRVSDVHSVHSYNSRHRKLVYNTVFRRRVEMGNIHVGLLPSVWN